jgi:hypothetical protein
MPKKPQNLDACAYGGSGQSPGLNLDACAYGGSGVSPPSVKLCQNTNVKLCQNKSVKFHDNLVWVFLPRLNCLGIFTYVQSSTDVLGIFTYSCASTGVLGIFTYSQSSTGVLGIFTYVPVANWHRYKHSCASRPNCHRYIYLLFSYRYLYLGIYTQGHYHPLSPLSRDPL